VSWWSDAGAGQETPGDIRAEGDNECLKRCGCAEVKIPAGQVPLQSGGAGAPPSPLWRYHGGAASFSAFPVDNVVNHI